MKRRVIALVLVLLHAAAPAFAQQQITAQSVRFTPEAAVPANLAPVGNVGWWSSTGAACPNGDPAWQRLNGTTLCVGTGGGVTSVTASAPLASSGGATPNISLTGVVSIANGGTNGTAVPTNNGVAIGTGTAYIFTTAGTATQVLVGGSPPAFGTVPSGALPNVGPGAGTYTWADGESLGLDAQGRVTAVTTTTYAEYTSISTPATPAAGKLRLYSTTTQGFERPTALDSSGLSTVLSRDVLTLVQNTTGVTITKGQVVYINGNTSNIPTVALAKGDSKSTLPGLGLAAENITNNSYGRVMRAGVLFTVDTSAFATGNVLYVSAASAGALTATRPAYPNFVSRVGTVINAAVVGSIEVLTTPTIANTDDGEVVSTFNIGTNTAGTQTLAFNNGFALGVTANPTAARTWIIPDTSDTFVGQTRQVNTSGDVQGGGDLSANRTISLINQGTAGSCGDATHSCSLTFNARGIETAQTNVVISGVATNSTFATVYGNGANGTDETALLTAARGPIILKDNVTPIGTIFQGQTSGAANIFLFNATNLDFGQAETVRTTVGALTVDSATVMNVGTTAATSLSFSHGTVLSTFNGPVLIQPTATTGSPNAGWKHVTAAHTALTASAEYSPDVLDFASNNLQFATGALTTQRYFQITQPTITFVGASTCTTCATVGIAGAPIQGTNATITNALVFWTQAGKTWHEIDAVGTSSAATNVATDVVNTTAAANNAQQYSPLAGLGRGNGWATSGSTSSSVAWYTQVQPIQGASAPTGQLVFSESIGNATPTSYFQMTDQTVIQSIPNASFTLKSNVTMSGTAIGNIIDTVNTPTSGDKILSVRGGGTEEFRVGLLGAVNEVNAFTLATNTTTGPYFATLASGSGGAVGYTTDATAQTGGRKWTMRGIGNTSSGILAAGDFSILDVTGSVNRINIKPATMQIGDSLTLSSATITAPGAVLDIFKQNLTTNQTLGLAVNNSSASLVGAQLQYSGVFELGGRTWNTGGTPADNFTTIGIQMQGTAGNPPTNALVFYTNVTATNTRSFKQFLTITDASAFSTPTAVNASDVAPFSITFTAGSAGTPSGAAGKAGGSWSATAGNGASASGGQASGVAGTWTALAGNGGDASSSSASKAGGAGSLTAGNGGAATTTAGGTASAGGAWTLTAGVGGTGASSTNGPGTGGAITFTTGAGGTVTGGFGGGNSGALSFDTGSATGTGTTGAITIGGTNASAINLGNGSINTTITGVLALGTKFTAASSSGDVTKYNNEATAGVGLGYILAFGQDVASSGGGAQNTTIATFSPATSGLYELGIVCSTTTLDTVTAAATYTDAVNTTAQTVTLINGVVIGTNSTTSDEVVIRANTSTAIVVKITVSSQATTKCGATIKRVN